MIKVVFTGKNEVSGNKADEALLKINDFSEKLTIPLEYWSRLDYLRQWHDAIQRLLKSTENGTSALITEMYNPCRTQVCAHVVAAI